PNIAPTCSGSLWARARPAAVKRIGAKKQVTLKRLGNEDTRNLRLVICRPNNVAAAGCGQSKFRAAKMAAPQGGTPGVTQSLPALYPIARFVPAAGMRSPSGR